jgi:hypothetical protein
MSSSSNSTAERIKNIAEVYKPEAKEHVEETLRSVQKALDYWKGEATELKSLFDVQQGKLEVLVKFIVESQMQLTPEAEVIIAERMEGILLRSRGGTNV